MDLAVKIVSGIVGFIAGLLVYPEFDKYVWDVVAFIGALAVAVIVYVVLLKLASKYL